MSIIHAIFFGLCLFMTPSDLQNNTFMTYQSKIKFELEKPIQFPDFTMEYIGKKSVPGPGNAK